MASEQSLFGDEPKNGNGNGHKKNEFLDLANEVIRYLNETCGTSFQESAKISCTFIISRLREGATIDQCKQVIDKKSREWLGTHQQEYLRPSTLFRPINFSNYLNSLEPAEKMSPRYISPKYRNTDDDKVKF